MAVEIHWVNEYSMHNAGSKVYYIEYFVVHQRAGLLTCNDVMQAQKVERKLICIPLIFVFLRMWGTIRFFLLVAKGPKYKSTSDLLLILQVSILKFYCIREHDGRVRQVYQTQQNNLQLIIIFTKF